MNRSLLGKQVNKELIDELKNNTQSLLSFLQNQKDNQPSFVDLENFIKSFKETL